MIQLKEFSEWGAKKVPPLKLKDVARIVGISPNLASKYQSGNAQPPALKEASIRRRMKEYRREMRNGGKR